MHIVLGMSVAVLTWATYCSRPPMVQHTVHGVPSHGCSTSAAGVHTLHYLLRMMSRKCAFVSMLNVFENAQLRVLVMVKEVRGCVPCHPDVPGNTRGNRRGRHSKWPLSSMSAMGTGVDLLDVVQTGSKTARDGGVVPVVWGPKTGVGWLRHLRIWIW